MRANKVTTVLLTAVMIIG